MIVTFLRTRPAAMVSELTAATRRREGTVALELEQVTPDDLRTAAAGGLLVVGVGIGAKLAPAAILDPADALDSGLAGWRLTINAGAWSREVILDAAARTEAAFVRTPRSRVAELSYNISKAALIHLTHQLAAELAPVVRVNAVAPGVVRTRLAGSLWQDREEQASAGHPMARLGEPADVARVIVFLASDAASWLTGVVLAVDGGVTGASMSAIS